MTVSPIRSEVIASPRMEYWAWPDWQEPDGPALLSEADLDIAKDEIVGRLRPEMNTLLAVRHLVTSIMHHMIDTEVRERNLRTSYVLCQCGKHMLPSQSPCIWEALRLYKPCYKFVRMTTSLAGVTQWLWCSSMGRLWKMGSSRVTGAARKI